MAASASTPKTMKSAILVAQRQPLVIDEVELPDELGFGQVLVRVMVSGLCGSQLGEIDGVKGEDPYLPHLLGHEGGGVVLKTGPGVKRVSNGDRVVLHWKEGPGIQSAPPIYRWRGKPLNAGWLTTFNTYAVVSENRMTSIADDVEFDVASLLGCAVTTGLGVVTNDAQVRIGESVVVFGAGGVGLNVIQGAALAGACPIIAIDRVAAKLDLARRFGATHLINTEKLDTRAEVLRALGKDGADVIVENTGHPEVIELAYELTGARGRLVLVGVPPKSRKVSIYSLPLHFGKVLTGSHGGGTKPSEDIPRYVRLYHAGRLKLRELITDVAPLERINDAIEHLRAGQVHGRCVIDMTAEFNR